MRKEWVHGLYNIHEKGKGQGERKKKKKKNEVGALREDEVGGAITESSKVVWQ